MSLILYFYFHFLISHYIPCYWQITLTTVINKTVLFHTTVFYLRSNPYILHISNIYNPDQHSSLASQTICDQMFSDPKLYHNFHVFHLHAWLICISSCMWQFYTYFKDGKVLKYIVTLFLSESNWLQPEYYFPPNNKTIEILLGEVFRIYHRVIRQPVSIYLDYLV